MLSAGGMDDTSIGNGMPYAVGPTRSLRAVVVATALLPLQPPPPAWLMRSERTETIPYRCVMDCAIDTMVDGEYFDIRGLFLRHPRSTPLLDTTQNLCCTL